MAGELTRKGKGRPAGSKNKLPVEIKAMVKQALEQAGGVDYLVRQAKKKNPAPFLALVGKCLPLEVTGKDGGAIQVGWTGLNVKQP